MATSGPSWEPVPLTTSHSMWPQLFGHFPPHPEDISHVEWAGNGCDSGCG